MAYVSLPPVPAVPGHRRPARGRRRRRARAPPSTCRCPPGATGDAFRAGVDEVLAPVRGRRSTRPGCSSRPASTPTAPTRSPTSGSRPATTPTSPPRSSRWCRPGRRIVFLEGGYDLEALAASAAACVGALVGRAPRARAPDQRGTGPRGHRRRRPRPGRARRLMTATERAAGGRCRPYDPVGRAPVVPARDPGFRPAPQARRRPPRPRRRAAARPAPFEVAGPGRRRRRWPPSILDAARQEDLATTGEASSGFSVAGLGRFRVAIHRQRGSLAMVVRRVPPEIPDLDELGLPPQVERFAEEEQGLVLVTGPPGSGKTTTVAGAASTGSTASAAATSSPSRTRSRCSTPTPQAIVTQREVGSDTAGYAAALRTRAPPGRRRHLRGRARSTPRRPGPRSPPPRSGTS